MKSLHFDYFIIWKSYIFTCNQLNYISGKSLNPILGGLSGVQKREGGGIVTHQAQNKLSKALKTNIKPYAKHFLMSLDTRNIVWNNWNPP